MKSILISIGTALILPWVTAEPNAEVRLALRLSDKSRIIGTMPDTEVQTTRLKRFSGFQGTFSIPEASPDRRLGLKLGVRSDSFFLKS
jgi:hypothetical protein